MTRTWQKLLQQSCRQAEDLAAKTGWDPDQVEQMNELLTHYPMLVNPYYLSLIDFSDPADPIRRMSIPNFIELDKDGQTDTSGELQNTVMPGLQHKYRDTALVLSTDRCAMYCRHCFRKRLVGVDTKEKVADIPAITDYIRDHEEIHNVLISGGDAFLNSNQTLEQYLERLTPIQHLDFIRFGTRTPVVLPQRITTDPELCAMLSSYSQRKQLYVVTQFNHPREITPEAVAAIRHLWESDVTVLNQTVLLKGVNDDPEIISTLLRKLTACGVVPYYIFQCRPALGVKNEFQVPLVRSCDIIRQARQDQHGLATSFRFIMSHPTGKIEIIGRSGNVLYLRYHHTKRPEDQSRIFTVEVDANQCWLEEIPS